MSFLWLYDELCNNNNNNSYIALYPVKIYKLAALDVMDYEGGGEKGRTNLKKCLLLHKERMQCLFHLFRGADVK